jgi:hypothetical protein
MSRDVRVLTSMKQRTSALQPIRSRARRAVVAGHNPIAQAAEMEAGVLLATPTSALMRRRLVRRQGMPRQPVEAADDCVGEAAGKQNWVPLDADSHRRGNATPLERKRL